MESRRENCLRIDPWIWSKKSWRRRLLEEERWEDESSHKQGSRLKTMSPWEVCGIYKFAIESTHGGRLMKFRNSEKMQINSKKIRNFGRKNFAQ